MQIEFAQKQGLNPKSIVQQTKTRGILTPEQAIKIFQIRLSNNSAARNQRLSSRSVARADASLAEEAIDRILLRCSGWPSTTTEADPLPESSRPDDPFHDDWRYWPEANSGTGSDCYAFRVHA